MAKHTPGPWEIIQNNHAGGELWLSIGYRDADGRLWGPVADLQYLATQPEEQWANARLLAAAPDLYEACKALSQWMYATHNPGECWREWQIALAAVRKAEGR